MTSLWSSRRKFLVNSSVPTPDQEADIETGDFSQFDSTAGTITTSPNAALAGISRCPTRNY